LTPAGEEEAAAMRERMPEFDLVVSSDASRAKLTAKLLSGRQPETDPRAYFDGVDQPARLNELIDELLLRLNDGGRALVVTHEPIIGPAMEVRGLRSEPLWPLQGYLVTDSGAKPTKIG
jgi:broad specificity phosphatase PhoE